VFYLDKYEAAVVQKKKVNYGIAHLEKVLNASRKKMDALSKLSDIPRYGTQEIIFLFIWIILSDIRRNISLLLHRTIKNLSGGNNAGPSKFGEYYLKEEKLMSIPGRA